MTRRTRIAAIGAVALLVGASSASAHGIGERGDLPLPKTFFIWAAALAVVLSFLIAAMKRTATPSDADDIGYRVGHWTVIVRTLISPFLRAIGLLALGVTIAAGFGGDQNIDANIAPVLLFVVLWIGVVWLSGLLGDIWRMLNPWDTLAMIGSGRVGGAPEPDAADRSLRFSYWPAAAGLFMFQWFELAHPEPGKPQNVAIAISAYTIIVLGCAARYGRVWIQTGEAITVLCRLVAAIAPIGRDSEGELRLRWPFVGLTTVDQRRGIAAGVLTVLGGTTFDGMSRSAWYSDMVNGMASWPRAAVNTLFLVLCIAVLAGLYVLTTRLVARWGGGGAEGIANRYAPTLVPIALAYSVAHYFSLLVFEGQRLGYLISDPAGLGWDLFGTLDASIDYTVVSTGTIAVVQTVAIVVGHAAAVFLAHDRALKDFGQQRAALSQVPMLILMIALTITGLTLLLSA